MPSAGNEVGGLHRTRPLGGHGRARHLSPALESVGHGLTVLGGGEPVASWSEVLGNGTIGGEETLRVTRRLESLHAPLPLPCGLVGIFRAVVEIAMLAMFHARQDVPLRRAIAFELVRDDHPWHVGQALEQLPEELLGGVLVPPTLD
jgi:hypothetical protein